VTHPDQVVFDLDPGPSVSWSQVLRTAERLRKLLKKLELKCFVKTTGGKGLHVHVPIAPVYAWDQVKEFSKSVVKLLQEEFPKDYTVTSSKKSRGGKIFLDYLRNDFGATAVVPYSLRAKDAPFVATPLRWSELKKIKGASAFDLEGVLKRLAKSPADPWPEFFELKQKISVLKQKKNM